ncbi:MAG: beta-agarase [Verrucomicrobiota bacterium]
MNLYPTIALKPIALIACASIFFHLAAGQDLESTAKPEGISSAALIEVDPSITRKIGGVSELDRNVYFSISDSGADLDQRVKDQAMYDYLVHDLKIKLGRNLGPVKAVTYWSELTVEDPDRPGYADIEALNEILATKQSSPSEQMLEDFGDNLDVVSHGYQGEYPEFMGEVKPGDHPMGHHRQVLPENIDASTELAVAVFKNSFNDFTRPRYFEPMNEPHWYFFGGDHLADWHLAMHKAFNEALPEVQVGGMCMSVAYMYRQDYRTWIGFRDFIDNTNGELDFYSFHVYDYLTFEDGEFAGSVQSGLPMEGVLDMVPNYTMNQFGKETPIVVSEHGGYLNAKKREAMMEAITAEFTFDEGFAGEMQKRSIHDHQKIRSTIANTLNFMDHPHTVKKAVPFILLNSFSWDPYYRSVLYVPENFDDMSTWVPTANVDFYSFFKDLKGHRVYSFCSDPDLQVRAFADGNQVYVVINNLIDQPTPIQLALPEAERYTVKRYGRNENYTPRLDEATLDSLNDLTIGASESLFITAEYNEPITQQKVVNEVARYSDRVVAAVEPYTIKPFVVSVEDGEIDYAQLRVAFRRPLGTNREVQVAFNGYPVSMPVEDSAYRLDSVDDYATTRFARINPDWIKKENSVTVAFPDGKEGTVGSVVLRTAMTE